VREGPILPPAPADEPAGPSALLAARKKKNNNNNIIDLTRSEKVKRKRELKHISNKKQSEKRRSEKEVERERLKSLSPGEKEKIAKNIIKN
jgi:hypothetical protein